MAALGYRVLSSVLMIAALALVVAFSWDCFGILAPLAFGAFSVTALLEFYCLAERKGFKPLRACGVVCALAYVVLLYARSMLDSCSELALTNPDLLVVTAFMAATMLVLVRRGETENALITMAVTLAGFVCAVWLPAFILRIALLPPMLPHPDGRFFLLYFIVLLKGTDIAAYVVGTLMGRHKLAPAISPKKTIEGCVAGLVASTVLGASLAGVIPSVCIEYRDAADNLSGHGELVGGLFPGVPAPVLLGVLGGLTGLILSLLGQLGDLAESLWKRDAGVKDSGSYIPGMGGVLDVLDSFIFAAPAMYGIIWCIERMQSSGRM